MKYRVKKIKNNYSQDFIYYPQYRYNYWPFWFHYYGTLYNIPYKINFVSLEKAKDYIKENPKPKKIKKPEKTKDEYYEVEQ